MYLSVVFLWNVQREIKENIYLCLKPSFEVEIINVLKLKLKYK